MCFPTMTTTPVFGKNGPYHLRRKAKMASFYHEETEMQRSCDNIGPELGTTQVLHSSLIILLL